MIAANRLHTVKEYYFSRKLKEVASLAAAGKPIINMGIGSPDIAPPEAVVQALQQALSHPKAHQYQSYTGLPELRQAMSEFYLAKYGVTLDAQTEVLPLMGSKEGIMHISMAFLNPGDEVLIPNPGYPTYASVTALLEARPRYYKLEEKRAWLPDLDALAKEDLSAVKLLWLNYPNMPTGAAASPAFYEEIIAFAKAYNLLIINDNPYSFIGGNKPQSLLTVPGAKDVAMELNSLSKTFNMAGWRVGMLMGKQDLITTVLKVKSNMDSGMFYAVQQGAIAALQSDDQWYETLNAVYKRRKQALLRLVNRLGCTASESAGGLFIWAKLPNGKKAEPFIDDILHKYSIFITPGTIFGSQGEGYIRFSLCVPEEKIEEAINRFA